MLFIVANCGGPASGHGDRMSRLEPCVPSPPVCPVLGSRFLSFFLLSTTGYTWQHTSLFRLELADFGPGVCQSHSCHSDAMHCARILLLDDMLTFNSFMWKYYLQLSLLLTETEQVNVGSIKSLIFDENFPTLKKDS